MGSIFKKHVTRALPIGATVSTKRRRATVKELRRDPTQATVSESVATWRDRTGQKQTGVVVVGKDGLQRVRVESGTYYAKFRDGDGIVQELPTGCRDKQAAQARLAEFERVTELVLGGILTSEDADVSTWQAVPMTKHVADYIDDLRGRGVHPDRIKTSETYLTEDCSGCGFRFLRDLSADKLRTWLRSQSSMSAAVYNWHSELWVAFGGWLSGKRMNGKRSSRTGKRRIGSNPFDGFGKRDTKQDRRRVARALTVDEMRRLLKQAQRRPLEDAMRITRGPRKGELTANVTPERRQELERLGFERALIYKTAILTGLRLNELRTLITNDFSFGDVPFVVLRSENEKNGKGSSVPLRSDLAAELQQWVAGRAGDELVFRVPSGLLRILNRDLIAAGIDKIDEHKGRVHLHALRHSTGTHLSAANVAPRTAQAVMRHSDISLTMNTYTDERLLNSAGAVELLPELRLESRSNQSLVAPTVAPRVGKLCHLGAISDNSNELVDSGEKRKNPAIHWEKQGFSQSGWRDLNSRLLRPERMSTDSQAVDIQQVTPTAGDGCTNGCTCDRCLVQLSEHLRGLLDGEQCRRLAELLATGGDP